MPFWGSIVKGARSVVRCCIFDLDGTLLNTLDDLAASCNHALAQYGYDGHDVQTYRYFVGNGVDKLIRRAISVDVSPEQKQAVKRAFSEHYAKHFLDLTKPYDGIESVLRVLKLGNIRTCVVSNKPHAFSTELISGIFGTKFFDIIIGASDDLPKKPSPDGVLQCIERLSVSKQDCVYIGDSDIDIMTAKNAGIRSIGAAWGFRGKAELVAAGADDIAETPKDIASLLFIAKKSS